MKNVYILIVTYLFISLSGCNNNIKGNEITYKNQSKIIRFDKEFFAYITHPSQAKQDSLIQSYPQLLPAIAITAANVKSGDSTVHYINELNRYYSHPSLLLIYRDALTHFDNVSVYDNALKEIEINASKELPCEQLPKLSFHVSGFKENVIAFDSLISISIDKYLGKDYSYYQTYFNDHERSRMTPSFIMVDYLKAWLMSDVIDNDQNDLLETIIYHGKLIYVISKLLPENDFKLENIIGYTTDQLMWCNENEKKIWKNITDQAGLNNTDRLIISGYVNDGLYTVPIGKNSPPRLGDWIGWQIVKQYATEKKATTENVIKTDAKTILKEAKYNL